MKKFLTVLLALSVVFTYSFSSVGAVFADSSVDAEKGAVLLKAKENAEKAVNTYYEDAIKKVKSDKRLTNYTESSSDADYAEAWKTIDAKARVQSEINAKYTAEISSGFSNYTATVEDYANAVFGINFESTDQAGDLTDEVVDYIWNITSSEVLYNLYTADRDEAVSKLDNIDWSLYSDTEKNTDGQTYLDEAKEKVAVAKDFLTNYKVFTLDEVKSDATPDSTLQTAITAVKAAVNAGTDVTPNGKYSGVTATYFDQDQAYPTGLYKVNGVKTIEDLENDGRDDAATIAAIKAQIQKNYAVYLRTATKIDKDYAANYVALYTHLAEELQMTLANIKTADDKHIENIEGNYKTSINNAISDVEDLNAYAEKYKAEKDADGNLVRDAAEVDKIVAKAKTWTYASAVSSNYSIKTEDQITVDDAKELIKNLSIDGSAAELAFEKEVAKNSLTETKDAVIDDYYPLEAAKVEANYAKVIEQIEAATTVAKVKSVLSNANITSGILTKTAVDAKVSYAAGTAAKADYDAVIAYVNYANSGKNPVADDYIVWTDAAVKKVLNTLYGEQGARTNTEINNLNVDAAAVAAKLPTVGGLAAAKKAAEEAIAALPSKITIADKAAVVAAWEAKETYIELGGKDTDLKDNAKTVLETAIKNLNAEMGKDFAIAVIKADKKDKAALRELLATIKEANKMFDKDEIFNGVTGLTYTTFATTDVVNALNKLRDAELDNVMKLIKALPINVTLDSKSQIEAARTAYDEFVKEWNSYEAPAYDAVSAVDNFRELALAEAALSVLEKDAAKKATESLKLSVSTKLYKNSKIRVNWKVKGGDASYIDGYQVWKSKKAQSGYSYMGKTKKLYMDNKKGLKQTKKGTRMYYKVRAFVEIDGQKYYSDWSNKGNRIWR